MRPSPVFDRPASFEQMDIPKRFFVAGGMWRPPMPEALDMQSTSEWLESVKALPLPETYLDVPPAGEGFYREVLPPDATTLEAALAEAAAQNRETIAAVGRSLKDADREWMVVFEFGESVNSMCTVSAANGRGTYSHEQIYPVAIVVPTDEQRAKEPIDWDGVIEAREGSAAGE